MTGGGVNRDHDVIIVGAGVIGAAIARYLSRFSIRTAIVEKEVDVSFGTSKANSGIIHAGFHATPGSLKAKLVVEGNRQFDRLSEELEFSFQRRGELVVAFSEDEIGVLHNLYQSGLQNNVPYMEIIGRERALEMEPALNADVVGGLYAPTAGIIGPYEYCFALVENAVANGVALFLEEELVNVETTQNNRFVLTTEKGLRLESSYVVNAAGLFADDVAALAGSGGFAINPRKGEEYLLDKRVGHLVQRVIFPIPTERSKGILIIPTVDGTVMIGPTDDPVNSREDVSTSRKGLERVFEHARYMIPSIRSSDVITAFAGLRPAATGEDFIIGATGKGGFINVAGIQSPGLTASPAIAEMVCQILLNEGLRLEVKKDFNPKRRGVARIRELVDLRDYDGVRGLIEDDRAYSKLVCRCENITEKEIVAAIERGHTTLDGIKFATRAGAGRCQGGFCTYRIMKIVQRVTGIPYDRISKKGCGSELFPRFLKKGEKND
jgi:glycerol-3-phosphate dehydrogenase